MMKRLMSLSKEEFKQFIDSIDVVLSDCDGVLWRETDVIPGSPETVDQFKQMKKRFFYVTNNNTKTRSEFVDKCKNLNYKASLEEIVCTSFLAAMYLKEKKFDKKVYVIGGEGITKELEARNIKHTGVGPDIMDGDELDIIRDFKPDPDVKAVIVGFDKHFSFPKLLKAATYLQDPNVHFIGTNADTLRPSPNNNRFPESGCLVRCIESACGRSAAFVGKPESFLSEYIIKQYSLTPERTLMIGDNLSTDILLGKRCGFKTLLVLSGVTSESDIETMKVEKEQGKNPIAPDYYTGQLSDVLEMLKLST